MREAVSRRAFRGTLFGMFPYVIVGVLLISLFATGCAIGAPGNAYRLMIDPNFTQDQQAQIVAAAMAWERAVPVKFDISVGSCSGAHDGLICIHSSDIPTVTAKAGNPAALGITTYGGSPPVDGAETWMATSALVNDNPAWMFYSAVAHELGHAQGMQHVLQVGALMNARELDSSRGPITCVDVGEWNSVRGLVAPFCEG